MNGGDENHISVTFVLLFFSHSMSIACHSFQHPSYPPTIHGHDMQWLLYLMCYVQQSVFYIIYQQPPYFALDVQKRRREKNSPSTMHLNDTPIYLIAAHDMPVYWYGVGSHTTNTTNSI